MRAARETRPQPADESLSDGEPAQAPPATGVRRLPRATGSQRRTHHGVTVDAGSQAVQDIIGSTPDGARPDWVNAVACANLQGIDPIES